MIFLNSLNRETLEEKFFLCQFISGTQIESVIMILRNILEK